MKNKTKSGIIGFSVIFTVMLIIFIFLVKRGFKATEKDSQYYQYVNLKFNGIVKKVKPLTSYGHDYGVILIEIHDSNKRNYDPRDTLERYLGVLKNKKVDLIFNRMSEVKIGDSIDFNVEKYKIYRNEELIRESLSGMPPDDIFQPFDEIRKNIEL